MLGAERGDEEAAGWLRDAAREASGQAPLVTLELLRRAEALLSGRSSRRGSDVGGGGAGAAARRERGRGGLRVPRPC